MALLSYANQQNQEEGEEEEGKQKINYYSNSYL